VDCSRVTGRVVLEEDGRSKNSGYLGRLVGVVLMVAGIRNVSVALPAVTESIGGVRFGRVVESRVFERVRVGRQFDFVNGEVLSEHSVDLLLLFHLTVPALFLNVDLGLVLILNIETVDDANFTRSRFLRGLLVLGELGMVAWLHIVDDWLGTGLAVLLAGI
jgi:hypothetical protein